MFLNFCTLRNEDSADVVWMEQFRPDHDSLVEAVVNRIRAVLSGLEKPSSNVTPRRCRPCRFRDSCPARMPD